MAPRSHPLLVGALVVAAVGPSAPGPAATAPHARCSLILRGGGAPLDWLTDPKKAAQRKAQQAASFDEFGQRTTRPEGADPMRKIRQQPWRISDLAQRRAARVRRARNAGWANPEAAADLRDDDLDPRKPPTERELAIMRAGIDDMTSSDSQEEDEYSEATTEKLEDLAVLLYRAYGPRLQDYNKTGTAPAPKHKGSTLFPDLDLAGMVDSVMRPLVDDVARRRKDKARAAALRASGFEDERASGGRGCALDTEDEQKQTDLAQARAVKTRLKARGHVIIAEEDLLADLPLLSPCGYPREGPRGSTEDSARVQCAPQTERQGAVEPLMDDRVPEEMADAVIVPDSEARLDAAVRQAWSQGEGRALVADAGAPVGQWTGGLCGRVYVRAGTHDVYGLRRKVARPVGRMLAQGGEVWEGVEGGRGGRARWGMDGDDASVTVTLLRKVVVGPRLRRLLRAVGEAAAVAAEEGGGARDAGELGCAGVCLDVEHGREGDVVVAGWDPLQLGSCFSPPPRSSVDDGHMTIAGAGRDYARVLG